MGPAVEGREGTSCGGRGWDQLWRGGMGPAVGRVEGTSCGGKRRDQLWYSKASPKLAIFHSGLLKPMMHTPANLSSPSLMKALATVRQSLK